MNGSALLILASFIPPGPHSGRLRSGTPKVPQNTLGQTLLMLSFTLWTDLKHKEPRFVEVTEGGMFMGHNCSINPANVCQAYFCRDTIKKRA